MHEGPQQAAVMTPSPGLIGPSFASRLRPHRPGPQAVFQEELESRYCVSTSRPNAPECEGQQSVSYWPAKPLNQFEVILAALGARSPASLSSFRRRRCRRPCPRSEDAPWTLSMPWCRLGPVCSSSMLRPPPRSDRVGDRTALWLGPGLAKPALARLWPPRDVVRREASGQLTGAVTSSRLGLAAASSTRPAP